MRARKLDYQDFVTWTEEEPSRTMRITVDSDHAEVMVGQWIEDDDTGRREYVCQIVATVAEIDLVGKLAREREEKREHRRSEYERLKAEFGQKKQDER